MPDLKMSGDIGFEELSPQLQALIGAGGSGGFGGNVLLKTEVLSVTATEERQKEFTIPKSGYIQGTHNFELRLGSVWIHPDRYQIQGNKVVFNENEVGIAQGRRLDFVFCYLEKGEDGESVLDGASLKDGSVTKEKLSAELQKQIDGHDTSINEVKTSIDSVRQSVNGVSTKLDSSVKDVESSNNFNSIKIIKNDGTATDVPIKILGGGSSTSLNVFKTAEQGGSFTATKEINSFVIDELEENMDVSLVFKNLLLVKNVDFTVDKETKTVALTFNLKVDETIYYILTGTSFSYNDLDGAPNVGDTNSLATTSKEVVGAVNEIYNRVMPKIHKSATELYQAFNDWGAPILGSKDLNDWTKTGSYNCIGTSNTGVYSNYPTQTDGWGNVTVIGTNEQFTQIFTAFNQNGKYYIRSKRGASWTAWKMICTDDITVSMKSAVLDANEAVHNGVYHYWSNEGMVNFPSDIGDDKIGTLVVFQGSTFPMQLWSTYTGKLFYRARGAGATEWSDWHRIATTTKISFSCTAFTGYTLSEQVCYTMNGEFYITFKCTKTDGTAFPTNARVAVATTPMNVIGVTTASSMGQGLTDTVWNRGVNAYINANQIYVIPYATDTGAVYITMRGSVT